MNSSFSGDTWRTLPTNVTPLLDLIPWRPSSRIEPTYEVDLITFHAFFNLVTRDVASVPESRELGLSLALGSGKGEVSRITTSSIKKRTLLAFRGSSKAHQHDLRPFITEMLVLLHPYLRQEPNIVNLIGFEWETSAVTEHVDYLTEIWPVLKIEFGDHDTLNKFLEHQPLESTLSLRKSLCHHIGTGLQALHKCHIVHGDLKPENIVICRANTPLGYIAKLCDFDLSLIVNPRDESLVSLPGHTQPWTAPEGLTRRAATDFFLSDVYSFGLIIWSCFSPNDNPFKPGDAQTYPTFGVLKAEDKILDMACSSIQILKSLKLRGSNREDQEITCGNLLEIFKVTLTLNIRVRSLEKALLSLQPNQLASFKKAESLISTDWSPLHFTPSRMLSQYTGLKSLHGKYYYSIRGSRAVAKASISTCQYIWSRSGLEKPESRSDAAVFLFRSYFEGYGVLELSHNREVAVSWLRKALEAELENETEVAPWVLGVDLIFERLGFPLPKDIDFEKLVHKSLATDLFQPEYSQRALRRACYTHRIDFDSFFKSFQQQGILSVGIYDAKIQAFMTNPCRESLSMPDPHGKLSRNGYTLAHVAASCGSWKALDLLYREFNADLNVKDDHGVTPIWLACRYSHADTLEWLINHGVKIDTTGWWGKSPFMFLPNFQENEYAKLAAALCKGGADINYVVASISESYLLNVLSCAAVDMDLLIVQSLLNQSPSKQSCTLAMRWAASACRLENFLLIEKHRQKHFGYARTQAEIQDCLTLAVVRSPFFKICNRQRSKFWDCVELFCDELGEIPQDTVTLWLGHAIQGGDLESFQILISRPEIEDLVDRRSLIGDPDNARRGIVEYALMWDKRNIFDTLVGRGYSTKVQKLDLYFPTLLHIAALRELMNGPYFCDVALSHGENICERSSANNGYTTALEVAVNCGNFDVADFLIQSGAPLDFDVGPACSILGNLVATMTAEAIPSIKFLLNHPKASPLFVIDPITKTTILHRAAGPTFPADESWRNHASVIDDPAAVLAVLLEHYSDPEYLNARDNIGCTPLHSAAYRGFDSGVRLLLDAGADPYLLNCQGMNPIHYTLPTFFSNKLESMAPFYGNFDHQGKSYAVVSRTGRNVCRGLFYDGENRPMQVVPGFGKRFLGFFGFIDLSKRDGDDYAPWGLERAPWLSRYWVTRRNIWHAEKVKKGKEHAQRTKDDSRDNEGASMSIWHPLRTARLWYSIFDAALWIFAYRLVFPEYWWLDGVPQSRRSGLRDPGISLFQEEEDDGDGDVDPASAVE